MFQVSRRADYAVRIMVELARLGQRCAAHAVAKSTGVPKAFLHKITADLVKAGLVQTFTGPNGGLVLARPAESVSMLDIVEAVEGPVCLNMCLLRPHECPRDAICPAHDFWGGLQTLVVQALSAKTLDVLVAEAEALKQRPRQQEIPYVYDA